ncbi:class I SAM-dependent methyltransferase [Hoeflea sp.]|uniref:class I SAM-dependent methyltransferase n=1 Tax=Hoeflea sp. TaxID=1940281 RepID=UPI003A9514D5
MNDEARDLKLLATRTRDVYERNAVRFDAERSKRLHEKPWLDRFAALLPAAAAILDAGCGAGDPIAAYFTGKGFRVTGIDQARAMIALARARYPDGEWLVADMRDIELDRRFDGIIGWNSFFHLTQDEQGTTLARMAAHLNPGGALMLTVGPDSGEVAGHVGDDDVYHSSLSPRQYQDILEKLQLRIVDFVKEDPDCALQTVLLAQKHAANDQ